MALTTIEYGSLASSSTLNNNFNYLDGRITTTNTSVSSLNSQISTINTNLTTNKANTDLSNVTGISNISSYLDDAYAKKDLSNTAISSAPYVKTVYASGTSGYNIWSNGYCEQWGQGGAYQSDTRYCTVSLPKAFTNTNYNVTLVAFRNGMDNGICSFLYSKATSSFVIASAFTSMNNSWRACGYLAEGEY